VVGAFKGFDGLRGLVEVVVVVDCEPNGFGAEVVPKPEGPFEANAPNPPPVPAVEAPNGCEAPNVLVVFCVPNALPPPPVAVFDPNPVPTAVVVEEDPKGVSCANALAAPGSGSAKAGVLPVLAAAAAANAPNPDVPNADVPVFDDPNVDDPNPVEPNAGAAAVAEDPKVDDPNAGVDVDAPNVAGLDAKAANPPPPPVPPAPAVVDDEPKLEEAGAAVVPNVDEPNPPPAVAPNALCPNAGLAPNPDWPNAGAEAAAVEVEGAPNAEPVVVEPKGFACPNEDCPNAEVDGWPNVEPPKADVEGAFSGFEFVLGLRGLGLGT
jgi:hypothetical protein